MLLEHLIKRLNAAWQSSRGFFVFFLFGFAAASLPSEAVEASELNQHASNEMQSLLLLIDDAGLKIEKRLSQSANQGTGNAQTLVDEQSRMRAAIKLGSGKRPGNNQIATDPVSVGRPSARWYSETGELLTVTNFVDPRVLRAPQQGLLVHGAIVARNSARFLIRGPLDAVSIEVYLPDITKMIEVRPTSSVRLNPQASTATESGSIADFGTVPNGSGSVHDSAATGLSEQSWRFDL